MPILKVEGIHKSFSGVEVLRNINLEVEKGEIHAIVGENGAGKSTLMKIIAGEHEPTEGKIFVKGKEKRFSSPLEAIEDGISLIHQEFSLVPQLTVYENIYLGREPIKSAIFFKMVDRFKMIEDSKSVLGRLGASHINPQSKIKDLSVADKQLVEIAKALSFNSEILIMDEPTAALTLNETQTLFSILKRLRENGVTILFISHRLEEIFEIADRVTVLRNGELIATQNVSDVSMEEIVRMMVGRSMKNRFPPKVEHEIGKTVLKVENATCEPYFRNVSFELKKGEILGIAGLVGCGNSQLGEGLFGLREMESKMYLEGTEIKIENPTDAISHRIFLVPEDRHTLGLVLQRDVKENHSLPNLDFLSKFGFIKRKEEKKSVMETVEYLNTKITSINQRVENLSGGNQQKVVLGKWLARSPKILILDEPTRGIDVGSKYEIYKFIYDQALHGVSIIIISSEMEEVINLSDRILVMSEGRITGELKPNEATQERILALAVKGKEN
jgi:ABC-type sugar transport system ATPase subunit